jgi:hypothetical protein
VGRSEAREDSSGFEAGSKAALLLGAGGSATRTAWPATAAFSNLLRRFDERPEPASPRSYHPQTLMPPFAVVEENDDVLSLLRATSSDPPSNPLRRLPLAEPPPLRYTSDNR